MGAIYKATDQNLKITVALKHTLYQNDYIYRVFKREDRILAALRHPALPRVTDYFTTPRGQFLVMGFIAGADLGTLLNRRSKPFSMDEALDWADQLLDALEYLHGRTPVVLHRDIKPQNIKITAKGELILLDFGLAKGTTLETSKGSFNSIYGYTPQYAPLEQIRASGTDPRSDLYSFAATLYHLLTKTPPINALERADQVLNHRVDPLCPIHELNPTVAPGISRILHQTMSLATDERPPTAAALRAALGAVRRGEPWMAFASLPLVGNDIAAPRIDVPITESPIAPPDAMYTVITPDATTLIPGATTQPIAATGRSASTNGATPLAQRHRLRPWALGLIALLLLGLLGGGSSLAAFLARDAGLPIGLQPSTIIASSVSVTPSPSRTATPRSTNTVTPTTPSPTTTPTSSPTTTASSTPTTLAPAPVSFTATPKPALRMPNLVAYGENQAKEILSELGIDAERISVIYQSRDILGDQFDQFPAYAVVATQPQPNAIINATTNFQLYIRAPEDNPTMTPEPATPTGSPPRAESRSPNEQAGPSRPPPDQPTPTPAPYPPPPVRFTETPTSPPPWVVYPGPSQPATPTIISSGTPPTPTPRPTYTAPTTPTPRPTYTAPPTPTPQPTTAPTSEPTSVPTSNTILEGVR